jgi:DNA processing protein
MTSASEGWQACSGCLRRSWLLAALSGYLDDQRDDRRRLLSLLAADAERLIAAGEATAAGRGLRALYEGFDPSWIARPPGVSAVCPHDPAYPCLPAAPADAAGAIYVAAPLRRLREMLIEPAVAIVGSRKPTDYGVEVAHALACDLAGAGVTVIAAFGDGVAAAAHAGALHARGPTVAVMPGGVDVCSPAPKRALYERLRSSGCVLSGLPPGTSVRRWCYAARDRLIARLAAVTVVVEADVDDGAMTLAGLALDGGRDVAAVPGRVTSPPSRGTNRLLADGAQVVRDAQDVLDLLYGVGARRVASSVPELERDLRELLARIAAGRNTVAKLTTDGTRQNDVLAGLTELELRGAVKRIGASRFVVTPSGERP